MLCQNHQSKARNANKQSIKSEETIKGNREKVKKCNKGKSKNTRGVMNESLIIMGKEKGDVRN